jgi:hypothetical protein
VIDPQAFRAWLETAIGDDPRTPGDIPLIGVDQLHLRDAQAAPLIAVLADIILSTCVQATAVPTTHANAA